MTKHLSIFYDGSTYTLRWIKALLWARSELRDLGVQVDFLSPWQYLPTERGRRAGKRRGWPRHIDAVLVAHHHSHTAGIGALPLEQIAEHLAGLRQVANQVVWLDTADSTGTTRFEVMPYVDQYWKKQLLEDRARYFRSFWAGRPHAEYYHYHHGVVEDEYARRSYEALDPQYVDKLRLSWNVGAGDIFTRKTWQLVSRPFAYSSPDFTRPGPERDLDVQFRGTEWPGASGWQRTKSVALMESATDIRRPEPRMKIPTAQYLAEMHQAFSVLSPFGWGEICTRDFEAFAAGAVLLKPRMDHLSTFPNWFGENESYIPLDWDFGNFDTVIARARERSVDYLEVAENAQRRFRNFLFRDGKRELAELVVANLGW